jgi:hypothetical protein
MHFFKQSCWCVSTNVQPADIKFGTFTTKTVRCAYSLAPRFCLKAYSREEGGTFLAGKHGL